LSPQVVENLLTEKGLPSNTKAERSILGAILLDNAVCSQAVELLHREYFFLDSHRRIFDKMAALSERSTPIDLITLGEELRKAAEFEQVGGATYLASLIDGVPRTDTIEHYAKIVKEKAALRILITAINVTIQEALAEEDEPETIISNHLRKVDEIRAVVTSDHNVRERLLHADDLNNLPPVEWLIDGEIPKRSLTVIFGQSGAGKSFVALDYALRVAQFAPVIYIAAEGASGYAARVKAWCSFHTRPAGKLYFWLGSVQMMNPIGVNGFLRKIAEIEPVMVVVDTLARCMVGGDENSAKDMGFFVEGCTRIIQATDATVAPVHHTGKTAASGPRGSSALYGAADAIIEVLNDDGLIQVRCEKPKDSAPFETRRLRLIQSGDSCVLIKANTLTMMFEPLLEKQRKLLEILSLAIFEESGARLKQLVSMSKLSESTVCYSVSKLKQKGYATQKKLNGPHFITEKGRSIVAPNNSEEIEGGLNASERGDYGEGSNGSNRASKSLFEGTGNPNRSHSNNSKNPLGFGVDWSAAGAVEDEDIEEGEL
jgi:hypothetical protein